MNPGITNWLARRYVAARDWYWRQILRAVFRLKARNLRVESNVVYSRANGQDLKLDLIRPRAGGPFPVLVIIPGGGWEWIAQPESMLVLNTLLAEHGFATAEVVYRLAPRDRFPAQIEDCKAAVRWLRANAAKYDLDPGRVGALGFSAGGQLASLLGVTEPADGLEGDGGHPEQSSRVRAVVDFFGPSDFTLPSWRERYEQRLMLSVLGATYAERPDLYERASPVHYVRPTAAPHLLLHGTEDRTVSIEHSRVLAARLREAGASVRLIEVAGQGHGAWPRHIFVPYLEEAVKFLRENLGISAAAAPPAAPCP